VIGRIIAERMRRPLGQPVTIENVGGADGIIGTGRAARAKPDGYTIEIAGMTTHVLNGAFYSLPYDVSDDFAPISPVAMTSLFLFARKTIGAKDITELIDWLKVNSKPTSAGVSAISFHLLTALLQKEVGAQITIVPYRGEALIMQDLVAGQIDLAFATPIPLALVRAGSIKAYAVASEARLAIAPEIPTFRERGLPALSFANWYALFAPKGTPKDIVGRLNGAVVEALADAAVRSRLTELGFEIFPREEQTPEALGNLVKAGVEKWWPIIKALGIRAQ